MNKKNKKEGISLIVLIITIIVMIIIAAAVIISISETGIIGKTSQAVEDTNINTIEEAANLALGELILNNVEGIDTTKIINKMKENGIKDKDIKDYDIDYTNGKISVKKKSAGGSNDETAWVGDVSSEVTNDGTTYKIYTAEDLAWVKDQVNNGNSFEDCTIELQNDIDFGATWDKVTGEFLSGEIWTGIGKIESMMMDTFDDWKTFAGTFDGKNHTISNMYCENGTKTDNINESDNEIAYFSGVINVALGATIKNLTVKDSYFKGSQAGAIVAVGMDVTIDSCHNVNSEVHGDRQEDNVQSYFAGGIAGSITTATISYCTNSGKIVAPMGHAYGIIAYTLDSDEEYCSNCSNSGVLEGYEKGLYYGDSEED